MKEKRSLNDWYYHLGFIRLDRYIVSRFLSTFLFILTLILAIIVVIDIQEKMESFLAPGMTFKIAFEYYVALIPYFANLLAPLFIFITVVFFTSKLAGRSEIIAMQAAGMSFNRLLRPYMISAFIIAAVSFYLSSQVIPVLNKTRIDFTNTWVRNKKVEVDQDIQTAVAPGTIAYFGTFDARESMGYNFSLEEYQENTLTSRLTARRISYDSLYHWTVYDYQIRTFEGLKEQNTSGSKLDTVMMIQPSDLLISKQDGEQLRTGELYSYIQQQKLRGLGGSIQSFEVEYHRRFASIPAAFILTIIGACLSVRKVRGGMGFNITIGLVLAFAYIFLFTISSSYAINGTLSPLVAAWLPNIIFIPIALGFYLKTPR
ncbi:MAG: LptF/LptG family permease [Porphyromonas sp.]|nr:LptF/LptG family permease [Porphyromonas sp.]